MSFVSAKRMRRRGIARSKSNRGPGQLLMLVPHDCSNDPRSNQIITVRSRKVLQSIPWKSGREEKQLLPALVADPQQIRSERKDPGKSFSTAHPSLDVLLLGKNKSCELRGLALYRTGGKSVVRRTESPLRVVPVRGATLDSRRRDALAYLLSRRSYNMRSVLAGERARSELRKYHCPGDFCGLAANPHDNEDKGREFAPTSEMLIALGRIQQFSPMVRPELARLGEVITVPRVEQSQDCGDTQDFGRENGVETEEELDATLKRLAAVRDPVQGNHHDNKRQAAEDVRAVIRRHGGRTVEVCRTCKRIYANVARAVAEFLRANADSGR